jgi:hypothetical protein
MGSGDPAKNVARILNPLGIGMGGPMNLWLSGPTGRTNPNDPRSQEYQQEQERKRAQQEEERLRREQEERNRQLQMDLRRQFGESFFGDVGALDLERALSDAAAAAREARGRLVSY